MLKQELLDKLTEIGTCEDDVQRRDIIAQLTDNVGADYDRFATLEDENKNLTQANESLRESNMKLFLQVTEKSKPEPVIEQPKEKRKFEDLFNEKGELK